MPKKKLKLLFFLLLLFLLLGADFVFALEITYPRVPGAAPPQDFLNDPSVLSEDILSLYAKYLVNLCVWAGGILALAGLIYGGILYLISTGKPDRMALAKNQISAAFFGLLILLSSYLILKTLSPQFINLKIPALQPITVIDRPTIPSPPTKELRTSINVEIPFGTIIEKWVFEGTIPWEQRKRIPRIKSNVETTREITNNLLSQSKDLKNAADRCECGILRPDPPCNHYGCNDCPPEYCTSDPCRNARGRIQDAENKNQTEINNLVVEQAKTEEEVRLLKEQLAKLERAEQFILDCYNWISGRSDFLEKKKYFKEKEWLLREAKIWEQILIDEDWATFYCPVSGTIIGEAEYYLSEQELKEIKEQVIPEIMESEEPMSCRTGIPVGEIIDRTKRTTKLLIDKLEILVGKDKELIDAVDKLQVLVSQCSSRNCTPRCVCVSCGHDCEYCVEIGCFGEPCPRKAISDQLNEIQTIQEEITYLINGKGNNDTPADIGVVPITEDVIPEILKDLEIIIRQRMKTCVSEIPSDISDEKVLEELMGLLRCEASVRGEGPDGVIIQNCCLQQGDFQKEFGECLEACYLEQGNENYKNCLQPCLEDKAEELERAGYKETAEILKTCRHKLNFYCCTP
ncbi:hypothetical protein KJA13_04000 [Patescibacteria group bacterium]|nr:hypothetical protein [Patescibacteria group bacterium]